MTITAYIIMWVAYTMYEGIREGWYYHYKASSKTYPWDIVKENEHVFFTIQRFCVLILLMLASNSWPVGIVAVLVFPFFHDGAYYTTRSSYNHNIYQKTWFAQSTTSTAFLTKVFTPYVRTCCALLGTILFIYLVLKS